MPTLFCDLGGVLFTDATPPGPDAWRAGPAVTGGIDLVDDRRRAFECGLLGEAEYALHLRSRLHWTGSDAELVERWTSTPAAIVLDVLDVLSGLHDRGWTLIGADDIDPWRERAREQEYGWALRIFDRVVTSTQARARRPDPRFFAELRRGAPRGGARLYVDDDPQNVAAARRAGLDAQLFTGAAALSRVCHELSPAVRPLTPPAQTLSVTRLPETPVVLPPS